mmetsp:Transcript_44872/g.143762  ORF Transcript_44872/g.143762 Transcript_44872/m.143762 type:complete len:315 (+) Transcript_44872:147-1091(+)
MLLNMPKVFGSRPFNLASTGWRASNLSATLGSSPPRTCKRDTPSLVPAWLSIPLNMPNVLGSRPRNFSKTGCRASNLAEASGSSICTKERAWPSMPLSMPKVLGSRPRNFSKTGCRASNLLAVSGSSPRKTCNSDTPSFEPAWPSMPLSMPKVLGSRPRNFSKTGCRASNLAEASGSTTCKNELPRWTELAWLNMLLSMPKVLLSKPRNFSKTGPNFSNLSWASSLGSTICRKESLRLDTSPVPAWLSTPLSMPKVLGSRPRSFSSTGCRAASLSSVEGAALSTLIAAAPPSATRATAAILRRTAIVGRAWRES